MPKTLFAIAMLAIVALFVLSVMTGSRIAAGGGALLLLGFLVYGYVRNKGASAETNARSERGAVRLRHQLEEEDARRRG